MDQMLLAKIAYGCRMIVSFWPIAEHPRKIYVADCF
jgi:hypothetical protein